MKQLEEWIKRRYIKLLEEFGNREFIFHEAVDFLGKVFGDSNDQVKNILSKLKRTGFLAVERGLKDRRQKVYRLCSFIDESLRDFSSDMLSRDKLVGLLKQAADLIRTRVDYTFILFLLFYKAISDKWEEEFEVKKQELIEKGWDEDEAQMEAESDVYHAFNFRREYLWDNLRRSPDNISEKFSNAVKGLAELNQDYRDIFSQFDFHDFTISFENSVILNQLVELFSKFSFRKVSGDILGDAYEWILRYFAPTKAKEGEVYTPREVIRLMIEILDPQPQKSIYDPALGSGGMLIGAYSYVKEKYGKGLADTLLLCGQEVNPKTLALAKMNMFLHDIRNFNFVLGDTLLFPKFKEGDFIRKFDYVIANPPWNQDAYDEKSLKKGEYWERRFRYGFTTKQSADWAWIQHMLASARDWDGGKVVVVVDTGCVSRGGREKLIRQKIVEEDLIETVILLPEKLFYNTGAPAVVIVFNKQKPPEKKGKILLINASKEFEPGKNQNTLSRENIEKIVNAYREFGNIEKFARVVTIEEIKEADYNLSPSRFVSVADEEEYRSIDEIRSELEKLAKEMREIEKKINKILEKL